MEYLEFEEGVEALDLEIEKLRDNSAYISTADVIKNVSSQSKELNAKLRSIYKNLDSWQTCQVARHLARPHTLDYMDSVFTEFREMHGDRMYADDSAIIGGLARFQGEPVMVIGHEKGRSTVERIKCNWGMPHPEGYRKALRLMKFAENFNIPLITLIDTPGAFCGIGSEERGISQAIGANLVALATLRTKVICIVIGEGGSGGALGIGVGDLVLMLEHSVYSVITPEGCAAILWKETEGKLKDAANAMKMRSKDLLKLGLIDGIIPEPVGGAHRDHAKTAENISSTLARELENLKNKSVNQCLETRTKRLREYGKFTEGGFGN